jgi:hypothetical protein
MARSDSEERPRLLLLPIFVAVSGWLLSNAIRIWDEIDTSEKWARAAELVLIAVGGWAVVWPEAFPRWRSTRGARGGLKDVHQQRQGRCAEPDAAADGGRDPGSS